MSGGVARYSLHPCDRVAALGFSISIRVPAAGDADAVRGDAGDVCKSNAVESLFR